MNDHRDEPVVAVWLRGDRFGLRAIDIGDAASAEIWHDGSERENDAVGAWITQQQKIPWGNDPTIRLMIVDTVNGEVRGGVTVSRQGISQATLSIRSRTRPEVRASVMGDTLPALVPWLAGELGLSTLHCDVPEVDDVLRHALEEQGFHEVVRLRGHVVSDGRRSDSLILEWNRESRT